MIIWFNSINNFRNWQAQKAGEEGANNDKNYGNKTIWLDPDDVMEYGTDPEIVRRYKRLDAKKARIKFYRISSKIFRYK